MKTLKRYLFPADYMADPSVHIFNDRIYIYPSHDWECENVENDNGDQYVTCYSSRNEPHAPCRQPVH